jgi:ABC-2 type transport system ATP-binding protein
MEGRHSKKFPIRQSNLDPQSRLFLWDRIRSLDEQGATILLITHDLEEADCQR